MDQETSSVKGLPENAYRELSPGEDFIPVIPAQKTMSQVTIYSFIWGTFFAILFSAAAAFLGLKIGQVFEAAIPIAILAVGISIKRKNALLENVIVQSIGASSGAIVAGAIFTIPGLYILNIEASFIQIFITSLLGGALGILFLIPFRRYFVKDMHGKFPFPEATATTEVLIAGESGGEHAKVLIVAALIGGSYDFLVSAFGTWKEVVSTRVFDWGHYLADKFKLEFNINIGAAVMGLGYIIGLKYALIIAAGSFLAWWVLVPAIFYIGQFIPGPIFNAIKPISEMLPKEIFTEYVRHIGIGAIAAAGMIGIIKSSGVIKDAFKLAFAELTGKQTSSGEASVHTDRDISMKWNVILLMSTVFGVFVFFYFLVVQQNFVHAFAGLLIVTIVAFLFTTVAAQAIAIVGSNPVSGMTLMTLILSSVILVSVGLEGESGMLAALLIGGVVCTALSMAGAFISDLKIGYWLGATPRNQEMYKFWGTLWASLSVGVVILILYKAYGFGPGGLEAPQASAMAAVLKPLMTGQPAPWLLYIAGAMLAIILELIGIPPLAFALGIYLPLYLNTPVLAGGIIAHLVGKSSDKPEVSKQRKEKGTLISSGFIAGGAIMGVVAAIIVFVGKATSGDDSWSLVKAIGLEHWEASKGAEYLGFVMFAILSYVLYKFATSDHKSK